MNECLIKLVQIKYDKEQNLLKVQIKENVKLNLGQVINIYDFSREIISLTKPLLLVDARANFKITSKAGKYLVQQLPSHLATAVVTRHHFTLHFIKLYIRFRGIASSVKLFDSEDKALKWLGIHK